MKTRRIYVPLPKLDNSEMQKSKTIMYAVRE